MMTIQAVHRDRDRDEGGEGAGPNSSPGAGLSLQAFSSLYHPDRCGKVVRMVTRFGGDTVSIMLSAQIDSV